MTEWQDISTAPRDGSFIVANALGQVCAAASDDGHLLIYNKPGFADWEFGEKATHWQPLPPAPRSE